MTKLLILSDSHGRSGKVKKMIAANKDADGIIYLGDGEKDLEAALAENEIHWYGEEPETFVYQVRGNCDRQSNEAVTIISEIDGVRFYITHGFEQGVKYGLEKLANFAREKDCAVALFGHTHGAHLSELNGIRLFNPGCAANGGYGIILIDKGKVKFRHESI